MVQEHVAREPKADEYRASYSNKANTKLAHTLHTIFQRGYTYERMTAHRLALKLIASRPTSGEEVAAVLCNYDWMIEQACQQYRKSPRNRAANDAAYEAYRAWSLASA